MSHMHRARNLRSTPAFRAPSGGGAPPGTALRIANFVLCQLGWFAAVLGAAHGVEAAGCAVVLAVMAWHLTQATRPMPEATLLVSVTLVGLIAEAAQAELGVFRYAGTVAPGSQAPLWIVLLWPLLGCMLNVSLRWMHGHYLVAALGGAVAGPLAFFGGARLGAAEVYDAPSLWLAQALGWAVVMPLLVAMARRFDGMVQRPASAETS